jgi:hypothetical protein
VKPGRGGCQRHQSNGTVRNYVWLNPAMACGAERRRLKDVINSDEEILGSDQLLREKGTSRTFQATSADSNESCA